VGWGGVGWGGVGWGGASHKRQAPVDTGWVELGWSGAPHLGPAASWRGWGGVGLLSRGPGPEGPARGARSRRWHGDGSKGLTEETQRQSRQPCCRREARPQLLAPSAERSLAICCPHRRRARRTHRRSFAGARPPGPPMTHTALSLTAPSNLRAAGATRGGGCWRRQLCACRWRHDQDEGGGPRLSHAVARGRCPGQLSPRNLRPEVHQERHIQGRFILSLAALPLVRLPPRASTGATCPRGSRAMRALPALERQLLMHAARPPPPTRPRVRLTARSAAVRRRQSQTPAAARRAPHAHPMGGTRCGSTRARPRSGSAPASARELAAWQETRQRRRMRDRMRVLALATAPRAAPRLGAKAAAGKAWQRARRT
jgi:hypothetical protein